MKKPKTWIEKLNILKEQCKRDLFPCNVFTVYPPLGKNESDKIIPSIKVAHLKSFFEICDGAFLGDFNFYGLASSPKTIFSITEFFEEKYSSFDYIEGGFLSKYNKIVFATDSAGDPFILDLEKNIVSTFDFRSNTWTQIANSFNDFMEEIFSFNSNYSTSLWDETLEKIEDLGDVAN